MEKHGIEQYSDAAWLPDGKRIVFFGRESGHTDRCYVQTIASGEPHPITPEGIVGRTVSPDGRSLVTFDSDGNAAIYPIEGDEKPRPIPGLADTDAILRWSGDGHSLYVYSWGRWRSRCHVSTSRPGGESR